MDTIAKAAFITSQAACCQARLMAMSEQNIADRAAGRPVTCRPDDFENAPNGFGLGLGHNDVVSFLREY